MRMHTVRAKNATGRLYLVPLNTVTGWLPKNNYVCSSCKGRPALSMLVTLQKHQQKSKKRRRYKSFLLSSRIRPVSPPRFSMVISFCHSDPSIPLLLGTGCISMLGGVLGISYRHDGRDIPGNSRYFGWRGYTGLPCFANPLTGGHSYKLYDCYFFLSKCFLYFLVSSQNFFPSCPLILSFCLFQIVFGH